MAHAQNFSTKDASDIPKSDDVTFFKVPIGKLGLAGSLLISVALACIAFFLTFFLSIIGVTIYDAASGKSLLNLAISYRYIAAPVGVVALLVSLTYLVSIWARHKFFSAV